ncbi:MAG: hypothetical protein LBT06_10830 [Hungatella sp.]|jgi:hypothetical protein|nr:hypothetical protein [Hungatella sp.]
MIDSTMNAEGTRCKWAEEALPDTVKYAMECPYWDGYYCACEDYVKYISGVMSNYKTSKKEN